MYDMFWKASAFKQTIPEEWKNKGALKEEVEEEVEF